MKIPRNQKFLLVFSFLFLIFCFNSAQSAVPQEIKDSISKKAEEFKKINSQIQETQKNLEETQEEGQTLKKG